MDRLSLNKNADAGVSDLRLKGCMAVEVKGNRKEERARNNTSHLRVSPVVH
jgi:hypothetical protein